jgi:predicted nuclease of predicted toxin-antitoxin system
LRNADDIEIFTKAKQHESSIIIITKDADFVDLIIRLGSPPKVILLTCGNTSNAMLKEIFSFQLKEAITMLGSAENDIVEIAD